MLQPPFPEKILFYSLFLSYFDAFTLEYTLPIKSIQLIYVLFIYLFIVVSALVTYVHPMVHAWRPENNLRVSSLSLYHVGPGLSHLAASNLPH